MIEHIPATYRAAGRSALVALALGFSAVAGAFEPQAWIDERVRDDAVLSVSAAHVVGDGVEYFAAGPVAPDAQEPAGARTRYQIGSLTKAFTHLLLAEMVADGVVGYDTTVDDLLGERVDFANPDVGAITLRELATHSAGLPRLPANLSIDDPADPYAGYGEAELLAAVASARERQPLGDHYAYSNFGAGLLGYLLGVAHGSDYAGALSERVLEPLGLAATGFDPEGRRAAGFSGGEVVADWSFDALAGAGALWSSAEDLVELARAMLEVGERPLGYRWNKDRAVVGAGANGFPVTRVWHVAASSNGPVYWHNGGTGGFGSFFGFRPGTDEAVVLLVSGDADPTRAGLNWLDAGPKDSTDAAIDESVTGQYRLEGGPGIGVFERDGKLIVQVAGQSAQPVTRVGNDWYSYDNFDVSVRFQRETGDVTGLELVQQGRIEQAARVADTAEVLGRSEVSLGAENLQEYVGEYAINPNAKFTIRRADGGLEARLTGQSFLPIYAKGDDVFFYKAVDAELHFERGDNGKVEALVLHQAGMRQRAQRLR